MIVLKVVGVILVIAMVCELCKSPEEGGESNGQREIQSSNAE